MASLLKNVEPETFVTAWQTSDKLEDVCVSLGFSTEPSVKSKVSSYASRLRSL